MTAVTPKPAKKLYEVTADGFLMGDHYKAGDRIELYPAQATYDLPPHGTMLRDPAAPAPVTAQE